MLSTATPWTLGCWFDGTFGQKVNDERVIRLAARIGFTPDPDEDVEFQVEQATEYLNDRVPDNTWAGWIDGDFGLWPVEA